MYRYGSGDMERSRRLQCLLTCLMCNLCSQRQAVKSHVTFSPVQTRITLDLLGLLAPRCLTNNGKSDFCLSRHYNPKYIVIVHSTAISIPIVTSSALCDLLLEVVHSPDKQHSHDGVAYTSRCVSPRTQDESIHQTIRIRQDQN